MNAPRRLIRVLSIALVTLLALALRLRAVERLPIDYDEDDYLRAGQQVATAMTTGDWIALTELNYRTEHPPLAKLAYGVALLPLPPAPEIPDLPTTAPPSRSLPQPHLTIVRLTTAAFGALEVLALAILNPLAGFFLAINTWTIKYTSQVMLEGLPSLTSALAVLFYLKSKRTSRVWLALSAAALGMTAASKYMYCVVGIAIVVDWLWKTRPAASNRSRTTVLRWLRPVALWGVASIAVFFLFNPYLWPDPLNRLKDSIVYHGEYAQSDAVTQAGKPAWQPFVWLAGSVPGHPGVFVFSVDFFVSVLALLGLQRLWKRSTVAVLWLIVALGFLLVWRTKWSQYTLIMTFPIAWAAAEGFRARVWEPLIDGLRRLREARAGVARRVGARIARRETKRALPWLIPGLLVLALIVVYPLLFQGAMALTDFTAISIRDGITGGVWRAVGEGLTGQVEAVDPFAFNTARTPPQVQYAGARILQELFSGLIADVVVFNVIWTLLSVGAQTALGLAVALALHQRGVRFKGWWRALFILPWAIPEFVGALIWSRIFEPTTGSLSVICGCPLAWGGDAQQTLLVLLIGATWMGWPLIMLAATAGLKLIPSEVYDAAAIDGAARPAIFRHITWPLLLPLLAPAILIRLIFAFNQFYLFVVMGTDFPLFTLSTLSYYLFDSRSGGLYAVSAAINVFTVALLIIYLWLFNRWTRATEGVTYA